MLEKLRALFVKYYDVISYLFFGVLTTLVNYAVYLPLYNTFGFSATVSNCVAWVISAAFAYFTNKLFVFKSKDWSTKTVIPEAVKFFSCRLGSGIAETVIIFLTVDLLGWNGNIMKLITSVMVVIVNYVGSKLLVFKKG